MKLEQGMLVISGGGKICLNNLITTVRSKLRFEEEDGFAVEATDR